MKVAVVQLVLITAAFLSGVEAVTVRIRAYNATGELDIRRESFTLGTRVLLTCDVTGLPEGSKVVIYRWYHNCAGRSGSRCEIRDGDPYYRVVEGTLLVDVTALDQGGRYHCNADSLPVREAAITREVAVAGNPAPFLYTPTSLLPEHSVLTDVQQATGRNGQQWITCRSGGEGTRPEIWMGSELVVNSSIANSVTIGLGTQHPNGLYHCLSTQSQREYFSLFLRNSVTPLTPTVSRQDTSMWTLTSPDGSRVERYIVEFECRVRNITFVEKYMSVNASGGTGRVATNVSCFGGLGQLYRVKVWAVSGPNISRALVFVTVVCNPPCANGTGVCVANNTCSCAPGYFGDTCSEQDFQPCEVNVCQNGGTCTQSVDLVICDCPEGFAGKQCQTAFTTPRVTPVAKTPGGYVIRWSISPRVAARVQNFRVTVFQLGSNDLGDDQITDIPQDSVYSRRVRALYITSLTEGHQYHVEVFASVGGVYGPPGAVDVTF